MGFSLLKAAWSAVSGAAGSILGNWQMILGAALLSAGLASFATYKIMHNANLASVAKANIAQVHLVTAQLNIQTNLGNLYIPQLVTIRTETVVRQKEIVEHVTPQIDREYPVPLGFVRVWNDASHGPIPPASAGSDADTSGVKLSAVADAHNQDVGTLDTCRAYLTEWWDWYDRNKAAISKQ